MYLRLKILITSDSRGGTGGEGAWENRGREGYGRRERKGREAGVLRNREAGEITSYLQQVTVMLVT